MKELFDNFYNEIFSQSKSQCLDLKIFELAARKFKWNYNRFFVDLPKDAKILDFGCGIGQFLFFLKEEGFQNITGIDISKSQIELALQMQQEIDFRYIDNPIDFLQQNQEIYDVITMNDVLEHIDIDKMIPLLQALHKSLRPKGLIVIKTVNGAYPLGSALRYIDMTHTTAFHERSLAQLLRHVGFIDISCYQEEIGIYNFLFLIKKCIVLITRFFVKTLTYFTESDWPNIISLNLIAIGRKK